MRPLLDQLGLDASGLRQRLDYLDWGEADGERLRQLAAEGDAISRAFLDELYDRLAGYPETAAILSGPDRVSQLKQRQLHYYRRLFAGHIDDDYLQERVRIGQIHEQVGVELRWYLGAYRLFLARALRQILAHAPERLAEQLDRVDSLLKIVFFDMGVAADAYVQAEHQALEASEGRYAHALRGANDGIWDWNVTTDRLYVSARWASMLGMTPAQLGEQAASWFARVHPADLSALRAAFDAHLQGCTPWVRHEYRMRRADGSYMWVLTRGVVELDASGHRRLAGSQTDISERRRIQRQLEHAAGHDALTGLINRDQLSHQLQAAVERLQLPGARHAAVLFIDLDRFKLINDSLGHAAGDRVLVWVAERLRDCLRPGDQLARFGGDEFVMLLDDLACPEDADQVAARALVALREPLRLGERCVVVSASIGVAPLAPGQGLEEALQAADLALYSAKDAGKARFERFDQSMQVNVRRRLQLESDLLQALLRGEFSLHYQPVVDLHSRRATAVEALLRWQHGGEAISPAVFVPLLEELGEIVAVGDWVLQQACSQVRTWQLAGASQLHCSVNLSGRQLQERDFPARLREILRSSGLAPQSLVLEITESLLIDQDALVLSTLRELAGMGVRVALDDFGTGYCSLGYLNRFPLHIIKLDRSFLHDAHQDQRQLKVCQALIALSRALDLTVVAEGIERDEQIALLLREHCTLGQGYLLGRPQPAEQLRFG